tara:strand:- start:5614 stop:6825 length:1212 start_codon:yes stop_codon:yes gene_type:complete
MPYHNRESIAVSLNALLAAGTKNIFHDLRCERELFKKAGYSLSPLRFLDVEKFVADDFTSCFTESHTRPLGAGHHLVKPANIFLTISHDKSVLRRFEADFLKETRSLKKLVIQPLVSLLRYWLYLNNIYNDVSLPQGLTLTITRTNLTVSFLKNFNGLLILTLIKYLTLIQTGLLTNSLKRGGVGAVKQNQRSRMSTISAFPSLTRDLRTNNSAYETGINSLSIILDTDKSISLETTDYKTYGTVMRLLSEFMSIGGGNHYTERNSKRTFKNALKVNYKLKSTKNHTSRSMHENFSKILIECDGLLRVLQGIDDPMNVNKVIPLLLKFVQILPESHIYIDQYIPHFSTYKAMFTATLLDQNLFLDEDLSDFLVNHYEEQFQSKTTNEDKSRPENLPENLKNFS